MKQSIHLATYVFLFLALPLFVAFPQAMKTTVEDIVGNPGRFADNAVEIEGLVTQYVPATSSTTSYYLLRGDYGSVMKVNTADIAPEINVKYRVTGIVYVDLVNQEPFVSERSRVILRKTDGSGSGESDETTGDRSWMKYVIIALGVMLAAALGYVLINKGRSGSAKQAEGRIPGSVGTGSEPTPVFSTDSQFKTVKIVTSSPKTLKFIPGQLVIMSGDDRGKSFRIAGYPTTEGSVASIGRETVTGDRAYSHIQLDSRFTTVSRKQAELVLRDGKVYVRNLSETNLTQVDGVDLPPGRMAELKSGSKIKTGELEFQYTI